MHPNSPNILTIKSSYPSNPFNYGYYGMADLTGGLIQITQINGIGLVTRGFVWQVPEIWFDPQSVLGLSTGWTAAAGYSGSATLIATGWTAAAGYAGFSSVISTSWSSSSASGMSEGGVYF